MVHSIVKKTTVIFSAFLILLLFALAAIGNRTGYSKTVEHHEWLQPEEADLSKYSSRVEVVKSGDTTGVILSRLGFPDVEVVNIIEAAKPLYRLKNIRSGQKFVRVDKKNKVTLKYQINEKDLLILSYSPGTPWSAHLQPREVYSRIEVVEGTIHDSLFLDANKAGLKDSLTIKLVDIFAWDIDFARDLRKGDSFKVMFEESFDDEGRRTKYTILAAQFRNKGFLYTAIRYKNKNGVVEYYNEEGRNLRKTYLKSPVKYSRISSRFRSSRKHPVLGYTRAHRGVDYAAKTGTPIRSIGDGKVVYKGRKGGYGRFVEIRHTNGIHSTAYAHMSRYGRGLKRGKHVKQGQVIGYVGMTGLATGPHLHFEFRSRGRAVNPLKIKHKSAKAITKTEMSSFNITTKKMLRMMALHGQRESWG